TRVPPTAPPPASAARAPPGTALARGRRRRRGRLAGRADRPRDRTLPLVLVGRGRCAVRRLFVLVPGQVGQDLGGGTAHGRGRLLLLGSGLLQSGLLGSGLLLQLSV